MRYSFYFILNIFIGLLLSSLSGLLFDYYFCFFCLPRLLGDSSSSLSSSSKSSSILEVSILVLAINYCLNLRSVGSSLVNIRINSSTLIDIIIPSNDLQESLKNRSLATKRSREVVTASLFPKHLSSAKTYSSPKYVPYCKYTV